MPLDIRSNRTRPCRELQPHPRRPIATFFHQDCTTCGRSMRVRIEHLGRQVVCQHCGCRLIAADVKGAKTPSPDPIAAALHRAGEWITGASSH